MHELHAGVAGCYCSFALSGASGSATAVARGKEAALQAIRMQPDMVAGHSFAGLFIGSGMEVERG